MLYVIATPIGNLEDISLRAVSVLNSVDLILAEDTRVTKNLLDKYNIKTPMTINPDALPRRGRGPDRFASGKINEIISMLKEGSNLALVSDAGTPGINDPGNYLISQILEEIPDIKIVAVPGANAAIAALSISGFSTDKFVYLGFPPHKKGRQTFFKKIGQMDETVVFYESKHRILKALKELNTISQLEDRQIMVARELTKQFETIYRGTSEEVFNRLNKGKENLLGEFVVVVNHRT